MVMHHGTWGMVAWCILHIIRNGLRCSPMNTAYELSSSKCVSKHAQCRRFWYCQRYRMQIRCAAEESPLRLRANHKLFLQEIRKPDCNAGFSI